MPERTLQVLDREPRTGRGDGELEALVGDLELRLAESLDRERLLGERLVAHEGDADSRERELRVKLRKYMEFHDTVESSRPWRLLQLLRGLVGRKW